MTLITGYYAAKKLWQLIPTVYRSLDVVSLPLDGTLPKPGPLAEIVARIGAEAAVLRRSIDRLWEDQSIESCDDWIIPYIGDLLATRLVACLDARAKRLDVAKTIYYRRRKGTVGLLEQLASDLASRDARIVEFFRRLGRTRHNFDPPIGLVQVSALLDPQRNFLELSTAPPPVIARPPPAPPIPPFAVIEGLSGAYTHTPMGGYADLRHRYGAGKTMSSFDEFTHMADFRREAPDGGLPAQHRQARRVRVVAADLSRAAVDPGALRRLHEPAIHVRSRSAGGCRCSAGCGGGAAASARIGSLPNEWNLPGRIGQPLFDMRPDKLYPIRPTQVRSPI